MLYKCTALHYWYIHCCDCGCDKHSVASLQILQNKAARIITRSPLRTSRKEMFGCLQWLTVRQVMFYHSALTTFRVKQSHEPEYLSGILSRENHRGKIIIPHSMLSLAMQSYCFRGSAEWNTLPQSIRRLEKLSKFKEELKKWIFLNIEAFWWQYRLGHLRSTFTFTEVL